MPGLGVVEAISDVVDVVVTGAEEDEDISIEV